MNDIEIALAVSEELDKLDESFFEEREVGDVINIFEGSQVILYAKTNDGVIVPFFRTMNKLNSVWWLTLNRLSDLV